MKNLYLILSVIILSFSCSKKEKPETHNDHTIHTKGAVKEEFDKVTALKPKDSFRKVEFVKGDLGGETIFHFKDSNLVKLTRDMAAPEYYASFEEVIFDKDSIISFYRYEREQLYQEAKSFVTETRLEFKHPNVIKMTKSDTIQHTYENIKLDNLVFDSVWIDFDSTYSLATLEVEQLIYESRTVGTDLFKILSLNKYPADDGFTLKVKNKFGYDESILLKDGDSLLDSIQSGKIVFGDTLMIAWKEIMEGEIPIKYHEN